MKKSKIAGLVLASILAGTPAAFAGGLGDMNLPDGRFNAGDTGNSPVTTHSRSVVNFYAPTEQSHAKGWYIGPYWWGYPFGFAVFNK
jgi:hypothetical protein